MQQMKNLRKLIFENEKNADRVDGKIGASVYQPACLHALIMVAYCLQKECRTKECRDAEQQGREIEPAVHNAEMVDRKCKRTEQHTAFRHICAPERLREKSTEKCFLQKGVDQRNIRKNKQAIFFGELFLLHEILPNRWQIKKSAQAIKSKQNSRNHSNHEADELAGFFLHFVEPNAVAQSDLGYCCTDPDQRERQEQLDCALDRIGRCKHLLG